MSKRGDNGQRILLRNEELLNEHESLQWEGEYIGIRGAIPSLKLVSSLEKLGVELRL